MVCGGSLMIVMFSLSASSAVFKEAWLMCPSSISIRGLVEFFFFQMKTTARNKLSPRSSYTTRKKQLMSKEIEICGVWIFR